MNQLTSADSDPKFIAACRQIGDLLAALQQPEDRGVLPGARAELLQEGFDQLTALINSTDDQIWFVNKEKLLLLANDASRDNFFELIGIEMRPGLSCAELLSPNLAAYFDQVYDRVLTGKTLRFNHTGLNGREYAMVAQPVASAAGIVGISVFGSDITELHQLQEELRRFEQVISSTPDLIALIDRHHNHQVVNDSYLGAFNKTRQEVLAVNFRELIGGKNFRRDAQINLDIAFSGETVHTETWVDLPGLGRRLMSITYQPLRSQDLIPKYVVINGRDITILKQAQDDRQRVFEVSLDMFCVTGFDGCFKELNPAWTRTLGWSLEELKKSPWTKFVLEEDREPTLAAIKRLTNGEKLVGFENRYLCKNGSVKWLAWSAYPDMERQRIFSVIRDITTNKKMEEELRHLATTDPLTGANNRRHFIEHVTAATKRSQRYAQPLAVLLMDIDYFKSVNDTYGHDIGDEALIKLVECCLQELRETDLFGRFGGEEFAAALIQTDQNEALQVCERLCEQLRNMRVRTWQGDLSLTVSVGLTMLSADDLSIDSVLKRADDALYRAKNAGRDRVVLY